MLGFDNIVSEKKNYKQQKEIQWEENECNIKLTSRKFMNKKIVPQMIKADRFFKFWSVKQG